MNGMVDLFVRCVNQASCHKVLQPSPRSSLILTVSTDSSYEVNPGLELCSATRGDLRESADKSRPLDAAVKVLKGNTNLALHHQRRVDSANACSHTLSSICQSHCMHPKEQTLRIAIGSASGSSSKRSTRTLSMASHRYGKVNTQRKMHSGQMPQNSC